MVLRAIVEMLLPTGLHRRFMASLWDSLAAVDCVIVNSADMRAP